MSNSEVAEFIKKKEKDIELTYREDKIRTYMKTFNKLKISEFKKAKEELIALEIPRLEEEHIIKIIDLMPKNGTELRAIVSHSGTIIVDDNVDKILGVLKAYQ